MQLVTAEVIVQRLDIQRLRRLRGQGHGLLASFSRRPAGRTSAGARGAGSGDRAGYPFAPTQREIPVRSESAIARNENPIRNTGGGKFHERRKKFLKLPVACPGVETVPRAHARARQRPPRRPRAAAGPARAPRARHRNS